MNLKRHSAKVKSCLTLSILFLITSTYNNCGETEFSLDEDVSRALRAKSIVINSNALYTNKREVNLTIKYGLAKEMKISNSDDCSDGMWEPVSSKKIWALAAENAEVKVYAKFRGEEGEGDSANICHSDGIIHDNIPPQVRFTEPNGMWTNSSSKAINFTVTDNLSEVNSIHCGFAPDFNYGPCQPGILRNHAIEGMARIRVKSLDRAGNESLPVYWSWGYDKTPPSVIAHAKFSNPTSSITATFDLIAEDSHSGVYVIECKLEGEVDFTVCGRSNLATWVKSVKEGKNSTYFRAIDKAGNTTSPEVVYRWVVDREKPSVLINAHPEFWSNTRTANFDFVGIDDDGTPLNVMNCKIGATATYMPCATLSSQSYDESTLNADDSYTFYVQGIDDATNAAEATYTWNIDTVPPTISSISLQETPTQSDVATFVVEATDTGSGVDRIQCQIDSGTYANCSSAANSDNPDQYTIVLTDLEEGEYTISIRAIDRAQNVSANEVTHTWFVDLNAPTVSFVPGVGPADFTQDDLATFQFNPSDGSGSGIDRVECSLDGGNSFSSCATVEPYTYELTNLQNEGHYELTIVAVDRSGRISSPARREWVIDRTGPVIQFDSYPDEIVFLGSQESVYFDVEDPGGELHTVECHYNGSPIDCTPKLEVDLGTQDVVMENIVFSVVATDKAGNESSSQVSWNVTKKVRPEQTNLNIAEDRPLDILFVIDNSGSMESEMDQMDQNIASFIDKIVHLRDWRIGVITTSINDSLNYNKIDGKMVTIDGYDSYFITPELSSSPEDLRTALGSTIKMNTNGSSDEQGIRATYHMIQRAFDERGAPSENEPNRSFFRETADFALVLLSDEDEAKTDFVGCRTIWNSAERRFEQVCSDGYYDENRPAKLLEFIAEKWPNGKNFRFYPIIENNVVGCHDHHSMGLQYIELAELTGTSEFVGDVCVDNYADQLAGIGQSVSDLVKTVQLACEPVDANDNGQFEEITVQISYDGGSNYSTYSDEFTVEGPSIVFKDNLEIGDYLISYPCPD